MLELYVSAVNNLATIRQSERGQTMAEYGIILALIAVICAVAVGLLGGAISDALDSVAGAL